MSGLLSVAEEAKHNQIAGLEGHISGLESQIAGLEGQMASQAARVAELERVVGDAEDAKGKLVMQLDGVHAVMSAKAEVFLCV